MSNNTLYLLLGCFACIGFFAIVFFANRDRRTHAEAKQTLENAVAGGASLPNGDVVFRKPKLLIVLSLAALLVLIYLISFEFGTWKPHPQRLALSGEIVPTLFFLVWLVFAIGQWWYQVVVSDNGVTVRNFLATKVSFEEISEIKIEQYKALISCIICLKSGRRLSVNADLADFTQFVSTLKQRLDRSRTS